MGNELPHSKPGLKLYIVVGMGALRNVRVVYPGSGYSLPIKKMPPID
jgi:hypothetical protein